MIPTSPSRTMPASPIDHSRPATHTGRFAAGIGRFATAAQWCALLIPMAIAIGSACAFFLWSLDAVTIIRFAHPSLLYFLPIAGFAVGLVYHYWGQSAEGGNNLIVEQIHQ